MGMTVTVGKAAPLILEGSLPDSKLYPEFYVLKVHGYWQAVSHCSLVIMPGSLPSFESNQT